MTHILRPLFPTAIYWNELDSNIVDKTEKLFLSKVKNLTQHSIHKTDFHEEQSIIDIEKELPELKQAIIDNVKTYTDDTGIAVDSTMVFNSWVQDYSEDKNYHPIHAHGLHGISGIYWIRANDAAGPTVFHTPNPYTDLAKRHRDTEVTASVFPMKPTRGVLVLFPAYLQHEVLPSQDGAVRSTIAFNMCI